MFLAVFIVCLAFAVNSLPVENKGANPEWLGGGYEGDMKFGPDFDASRGVAIFGAGRRWPNRIIPYDISAISNANDRKTITDAMNKLMYDVGTPQVNGTGRTACVFFRPSQNGDKEILKIQYGNGCSAHVGYGTNYQKILTLQQNGCFHSGTIQHELTHVLGFFHEQSRPDRDSFIKIHTENIIENQEHNFKKYADGSDVELQGFGYDYGSLMHYGTDYFTKNGKPTITPVKANTVIGQRDKLSATDIAEIRHYYKC
ncbi:unnamed protein product [Rotaria magnacalcarata]|uniref:Metalloendopeptidase n=1 Tax=Rotaria magnacalcarata TaxID=392030 RepID=A0A816LTH6_9BILA|nr:unnamed protein product [Rotaria magnacalcarata]CAF2035146.1 unnamed protein product [Rotaria magnacalcarata]CAF2260136.1 unnamed protein product [Rotaria magnacalcarata]CAF4020528.1 unnamed protein product [Rotaria magnacalcarata]CAF4314350.1 unnamed protein product [Rotaria magnacalcarata]